MPKMVPTSHHLQKNHDQQYHADHSRKHKKWSPHWSVEGPLTDLIDALALAKVNQSINNVSCTSIMHVGETRNKSNLKHSHHF